MSAVDERVADLWGELAAPLRAYLARHARRFKVNAIDCAKVVQTTKTVSVLGSGNDRRNQFTLLDNALALGQPRTPRRQIPTQHSPEILVRLIGVIGVLFGELTR